MPKPFIPLPLAVLQAILCFTIMIVSYYDDPLPLFGVLALIFGMLSIIGLLLLPKKNKGTVQ